MRTSVTRRKPRRSRRGRGRGRKIRNQTHYEQHPSYFLTQQGGASRTANAHLKMLKRASGVIRELDRELKVGLGQTQLLKRAVAECAAANSAVSAKLRAVSNELSSRANAPSGTRATVRSAAKLQQIATKLSKTLEESQQLRQHLREARNELGEAQDAVLRARRESEELRSELRRAGAARAEAALRPLADEIRVLQPLIGRIQDLIRTFHEEVNWRNWRPRAGELGLALQPIYDQLPDDTPGTGNVTAANAAPQIQAVLQAVSDKFARVLPTDLEPTLQVLQRELRTLTDSVTASLRAVERVPADARGGGWRRGQTVRKRRRACK